MKLKTNLKTLYISLVGVLIVSFLLNKIDNSKDEQGLVGADSTISNLTELTTVADEDLLVIVDDPSGTPTTKNITRLNLLTSGEIGGSVSVSTNFEVGGYASASFFQGTAFGGIDCNDATDKLLWSAGLFTCGTLADADIPNDITIDLAAVSNELTCTDCINATEIEDIYLLLTGGTLSGHLSGTTASLSGNFQTSARIIGGTASHSLAGSFSGAGLSDCDTAATSKLLWDVTGGKFSCGTDATGGGGVSSNSLDFDEFVDAMTLDANLTVASAGFNIDWNDIEHTTGGQFILDVDGGFNTEGSLVFGAGNDASIYFDGTDLFIANDGAGAGGIRLDAEDDTLEFYGSGVLQFLADLDGIDLITGNAYLINNTSVLNATTLGTGVLTSSLTTVGTIGTGVWEGTAVTDSFVADAITINGGTIGSNNISATSTWTTLGTLTIGDGGDAVDFATSTWDITAGVLTGLTISTNNVSGTWTTTGNLTIGDNGDDVIIDSDTWNVSSLGAFTGVTGLTSTGVIDFNGASQFTLALNATINSDGDLSFHSASNSLDIWNGTNTTAIDTVCTERKTFMVDSPTSDNPKWVGQVQFDNPFTITKISQVATQSNSAGWNIIYGPANSQTTKVFTLEKSASNSSVYTSFANSTVLDGNVLSVVISSTSATLDSFSVTICGFLNH